MASFTWSGSGATSSFLQVPQIPQNEIVGLKGSLKYGQGARQLLDERWGIISPHFAEIRELSYAGVLREGTFLVLIKAVTSFCLLFFYFLCSH